MAFSYLKTLGPWRDAGYSVQALTVPLNSRLPVSTEMIRIG